MKKDELKRLIDTAAGRIPADVVIKIVRLSMYSPEISQKDLLPSVEIRLRELESTKGKK